MASSVNIRVPEDLKTELDAYEVNMSAVARDNGIHDHAPDDVDVIEPTDLVE